jgi:hypothetical protein
VATAFPRDICKRMQKSVVVAQLFFEAHHAEKNKESVKLVSSIKHMVVTMGLEEDGIEKQKEKVDALLHVVFKDMFVIDGFGVNVEALTLQCRGYLMNFESLLSAQKERLSLLLHEKSAGLQACTFPVLDEAKAAEFLKQIDDKKIAQGIAHAEVALKEADAVSALLDSAPSEFIPTVYSKTKALTHKGMSALCTSTILKLLASTTCLKFLPAGLTKVEEAVAVAREQTLDVSPTLQAKATEYISEAKRRAEVTKKGPGK